MQKQSEHESDLYLFKIIQIAKIFTISLIVISVFTIGFLSVFFPKNSAIVIEKRKAYLEANDQKLKTDEQLRICFLDYQEGKITSQELNAELHQKTNLILKLLDDSDVKKKRYEAALDNEKIFGFRNIKIFFGHLGTPSVIVSLAIYLLFLFFREDDLFFKKVTLSFSIVGLITGFFYISWVFYPSPDVPKWAYIALLFIFSILGTFLSYIITNYYYKLSKIDLIKKTQDLISYIVFDIKAKYIQKQDRKEYISDYLNEIDKLSQE